MYIMNNEEIYKIKDLGLSEIRIKYWNLKHKAFLDEQNISDYELEKVFDELDKQENIEVEKYLQQKK